MNTPETTVALPGDKVEHTLAGLIRLYRSDSRPWVVAYSGGKDSTALLQLVVLLLERHRGQVTKPVYVLASDTRVESPKVADYLRASLTLLETYAQRQGLPIHPRLIQPEIDETFWVKLIGKGYPPPTRWFRWCTSNMKIKPARRAIEDITAMAGSVILLLGSRHEESQDRSRRMLERVRTELGLNPHHEIPNALVATPIEDWSTDEVWAFLFNHDPPPWGGSHRLLFDLYRQANSGECPLVLDLNTPSCGGSRFGCWTCTVVKADKSMQGFILAGENHMQPLADFRDWLKVIREDTQLRSPVTRTGQNKPGPFTAEARCMILDRLLSVERQVGRELISIEEIARIQWQWQQDFDYADKAYAIARKHGRELVVDSPNPLNPVEEGMLEEIAVEIELNPEHARALLSLTARYEAEQEQYGAKADYERNLQHLVEDIAAQAEGALKA